MKNKKKDLQPLQSDIHTIVDLPIEAVLEHITTLSPKDYHVEIRQRNSDEASFLLENTLYQEAFNLQIMGRVRRWNGTFTRVDVQIKKQFTVVDQRLRLMLPSGLTMISFPILFMITQNIAEPYRTGLIVTCLILLYIFVAVSVLPSLRKFNSPLLGYSSDDMIGHLVSELTLTLKQKAASLEFDGTEDNLELQLNDEKYKNFRLSADGELHTP